jgi:cell division protease FtsH
MKFALASVAFCLSSSTIFTDAFVPARLAQTHRTSTARFALEEPPMPPAVNVVSNTNSLPVIQALPGGAPTPVRYSEFLKLVNADRVEKVTFSADGSQLLGVDTDGVRLAIEALPNDPELLTQLTNHKVCTIRAVLSCVVWTHGI